jgi:DNA-directed RNA polymerase specialized sigma24 family protein
MVEAVDDGDSRTAATDPVLRAAQAGDREALAALVMRYERQVYRFGLSMCRDVDDPQESSTTPFLSMVRFLPAFRADGSLSTWDDFRNWLIGAA